MEMEFDKLYNRLMSEGSWANIIAKQTFGKSPLDKKLSIGVTKSDSTEEDPNQTEEEKKAASDAKSTKFADDMRQLRLGTSKNKGFSRQRPRRTYGQSQVRSSSTYEPGERY